MVSSFIIAGHQASGGVQIPESLDVIAEITDDDVGVVFMVGLFGEVPGTLVSILSASITVGLVGVVTPT